MKRLIASLILFASPVVFAGHGHGHHWHGPRHHHHHWNHNHGWIAPALIGGVIGYALTRPAPVIVQQPEVVVVPQQPVIVQPTQCFITVKNPYTERDETVAVSCAR